MKIYKLLSYLLLGIRAYVILNANNTDLYAKQYPLEQANSTVTQEQTYLRADFIRPVSPMTNDNS